MPSMFACLHLFCSSNFPKTKAYGHARWLMKKESISLKNWLESHEVVLLAIFSAALEALINLQAGKLFPKTRKKNVLDDFYLVISLSDHFSHWLEKRNLRKIYSWESLILNWLNFSFYVTSAQLYHGMI